ncbi:MAG: hypothetical protein V4557_08905 [Bacteroidota bacterium]
MTYKPATCLLILVTRVSAANSRSYHKPGNSTLKKVKAGVYCMPATGLYGFTDF